MCTEELNNINQEEEINIEEKVEVLEDSINDKLKKYEDLLGF